MTLKINICILNAQTIFGVLDWYFKEQMLEQMSDILGKDQAG